MTHITAKFPSVLSCGHHARKGDLIWWDRQTRKGFCLACGTKREEQRQRDIAADDFDLDVYHRL